MRIAIWAPVLYPWMIKLGEVLNKKGHEAIIFSNGIFGNYPSWKRFERDVILIPKIRLFNGSLSHTSLFRSFLRSKPDLLIVLATESFTSMALTLVAKILGIRTILIVENNLERRYDTLFEKIGGRLKRLLVKYIHTNARVLVAESDASYEYLMRIGCSSKKVSIIPHGTDIELFRPIESDIEFLRKYNISGSYLKKIKVLYLGGFNHSKGIDYLVETIQNPALDEIAFLIVTFGPLISKYKSRLETRKNVCLLPLIEYDDMVRLYSLSDIVITPSISNEKEGSERSPNVVIEALACGKVVVGTNVGGIPTYIGDAGLIIPERSSKAIVEAIIKLELDKNLMKRMKVAARHRAEDVFDIKKYADKLLKLYDTVLS